MLTLTRSLNRIRGSGAPQALPDVYDRLANERRVRFRRGQLSMIAGASGCGKSLWALDYAIRAGRPCLYFSADTDEQTMCERAISEITGLPQEHVRTDRSQQDYYQIALEQETSHIQWEFDSNMGPSDIQETIDAFALVNGDWPHLIVFDVLLSYQPGAGDWESSQEFMLQCKDWASLTKAHVMVLHHTVGAWADNPNAPPKSAIINKIDQFPSVILTMGRDGDHWNLAVVKNRNGRSDPQAHNPMRFDVNFETVQVKEAA